MSQTSTTATLRRNSAGAHAPEPALSPRSHKARREKARERILAAAYRIVANGGFDDITLAGVGEAAGYSRALPAHYFGSKEELIGALADSLLTAHENYVGHMSAGEGGLPTLLNSVKQLLDQPLQSPDSIRAFHSFMGAAVARPQLAVAARRVNEDAISRLVKLIEQGQARGQIRADLDARSEARAIFGSVRGMIGLWLVDNQGYPLAEVRDTYIAQLKRALAA